MTLALGWWLLPFFVTVATFGLLTLSLATDPHKSYGFVVGAVFGYPIAAIVSLIFWIPYLVVVKWPDIAAAFSEHLTLILIAFGVFVAAGVSLLFFPRSAEDRVFLSPIYEIVGFALALLFVFGFLIFV